MNEFEFIEEYLAPLASLGGLGLKDDAAILKPRLDMDLIFTKDTMVEGVHFFKDDLPIIFIFQKCFHIL